MELLVLICQGAPLTRHTCGDCWPCTGLRAGLVDTLLNAEDVLFMVVQQDVFDRIYSLAKCVAQNVAAATPTSFIATIAIAQVLGRADRCAEGPFHGVLHKRDE